MLPLHTLPLVPTPVQTFCSGPSPSLRLYLLTHLSLGSTSPSPSVYLLMGYRLQSAPLTGWPIPISAAPVPLSSPSASKQHWSPSRCPGCCVMQPLFLHGPSLGPAGPRDPLSFVVPADITSAPQIFHNAVTLPRWYAFRHAYVRVPAMLIAGTHAFVLPPRFCAGTHVPATLIAGTHAFTLPSRSHVDTHAFVTSPCSRADTRISATLIAGTHASVAARRTRSLTHMTRPSRTTQWLRSTHLFATPSQR